MSVTVKRIRMIRPRHRVGIAGQGLAQRQYLRIGNRWLPLGRWRMAPMHIGTAPDDHAPL